jgi:hypothetical protein
MIAPNKPLNIKYRMCIPVSKLDSAIICSLLNIAKKCQPSLTPY